MMDKAFSSKKHLHLKGFHADLYRNFGPEIVTPKMVWYPWTVETTNKLLFLVMTWLFHYIPAYVIDTVCLLLGKPQRFVKLYKKVYKANIVFSYFLLGEWLFDDENTYKLYKDMSETDKAIFNFNVETLNIKELVVMWMVGLRKYIVKDNLQGTEHAKRKWYMFRILHYITLVLYALFWWKLFNWVFSLLSITLGYTNAIVQYTSIFKNI